MVSPEDSLLKEQQLQIGGYSIIYDKHGRFAGYSDDAEDIQHTKEVMARSRPIPVSQVISGEIPWDARKFDSKFDTDVPWQNPPMTYQEYCTMSTSENQAELRKKWADWNAWRVMRYRPCWGEIRPAPDGRRRTIDSPWPDKIWRTGHEDLWKERKLAQSSSQNQNQEPPSPDGDSELMNINGQSSIQKSDTVESRTLQGSEGQLRKPTIVVRADVIAARCHTRHNLVDARSDDLLASQAENRLELDLSGKAEVISSLKEGLGPDFQVSKSKDHPNCSLVRPVNPESASDSPTLLNFKGRRKEMEEIEHFLDRDFMHFGNFAPFLRRFKPRKERDDWLLTFFQKAYRNHDFRGDDSLFNERCYQASRYVSLYDQAIVDTQGRREESQEAVKQAPSYDLASGNWVLRPFNLGRCERTYGPSHVVDGGGDAPEPAPLCCEKPFGPSRCTGDATQRSSQDMDRSSPVQFSDTRAESDRHNVDTDLEGYP
jgi:hypothetical protein